MPIPPDQLNRHDFAGKIVLYQTSVSNHACDAQGLFPLWGKKNVPRANRSNFNSLLCQRGAWLRRANGGGRAP